MTHFQPRQFFTWSDVRDCIGSEPAAAWGVIEVDPCGIYAYGDDPEKVKEELARRLGAAYDNKSNSVTLESTSATPRLLPVDILPVNAAPDLLPPTQRPLWSAPEIDMDHAPQSEEGDPKIAAFFSFKGGVGRTTACFATAIRLLSAQDPAQRAKVLYVDADIEAPGLTLMAATAPDGEEWSTTLSWVDALALVQDADEDWQTEALPLIAECVQNSTVSLELQAGHREFLFMPAVRSMQQVEQPPIAPEHMVCLQDREWVIGDLLIQLGRRLEVDVILVDLRAGVTEFSSPLLLDPRVHTVIVSSCARQSLVGVCRTIDQIKQHTSWPLGPQNLTFLITQVPPKPQGDDIFNNAEAELMNTWVKACDTTDNNSDEEELVETSRIDYDQSLIAFDDLQLMAERFPRTSFWPALEKLTNFLTPEDSSKTGQDDEEIKDKKENIKVKEKIVELTRDHLEYAELNTQSGILPTPPIRALVGLPKEQLPATVILGSKGAGKTFLWSQLLMKEDFKSFSQSVGGRWTASQPALIFPLLIPQNLEATLRQSANKIEIDVLRGREKRQDATSLSRELENLDSQNKELSFWLQGISDRLGLRKQSNISLRTIDEELDQLDQRLILIVDGLEDALQIGPNKPMKEEQKKIIRHLIIDIPNELRAIQAKHLGIIVFIRYDLARECINQNFGQFEAKYRSFALKWNKEDALRLVLWVIQKAGWPGLGSSQFLDAPYDDLKTRLEPFWGEKMGGTKAAFTDRWVIAALSDLKGRFQARDIIRLLCEATRESSMFPPLNHNAMRGAIEICSRKKVEELEQEIQGLKPIFDKLRKLPQASKIIPVATTSKLRLNDQQKSFLMDQGILIEDEKDNQLYMPEIIWKGLGFQSSKRGRIGTLRLQRLAADRER